MTAARACTRWPASHASDTPSTSHPHHIQPFETMRGHSRCMRRPLWPCAGAQRSRARVRGELQQLCGHCSSAEELMAQPSGRSRPCHLPDLPVTYRYFSYSTSPACRLSSALQRQQPMLSPPATDRRPHDLSPTHVSSRTRSTRAGSSEQTSRRAQRPAGRQGRKCRVRFRTVRCRRLAIRLYRKCLSASDTSVR